jgi:hypothetical protein
MIIGSVEAYPCSRPEVLLCCQAYLLFRAALAEPYTFGAGSESLEVQLVAPEDIQWEEVHALSVGAVFGSAEFILSGGCCPRRN